MDPALKTAAALCILLVGISMAMLFRHDRPQAGPPGPDAADELLLRYRGAGDALGTRSKGIGRSATTQPEPPQAIANPQPATVVTPLDRHESPPSLAPDYPETERPASSRWGVSMDMMLPVTTSAEDEAHTHTVVDGDTLAALAERYLGSSARAEEIYQANRDVLRDPKLLPIGVELKLPPRAGRAAPAPSSGAPPSKPLVPVRRESSSTETKGPQPPLALPPAKASAR
jgi:phage tail protein X